jgi:hypothetical protein
LELFERDGVTVSAEDYGRKSIELNLTFRLPFRRQMLASLSPNRASSLPSINRTLFF